MNKHGFISVCKTGKVLPLYVFALFLFCMSTLCLLTSCGTSSGYFKLEGRFLHINQGELYVYSPDGGIEGMDTIKIEAGRFAYETKMEEEATLMLVFPNFSEHPVFAESGAAVEIQADASRLKEMTVDGTDENELMNQFRNMVRNASPPEEKQLAVQFIKDHPTSLVSTYLIRKYLLQTAPPDYMQALNLVNTMLEEDPHNSNLLRMKQRIAPLTKATTGNMLPAFTATDINGNTVSDRDFRNGTTVISLWLSQNYESMEQQRKLKQLQEESGNALKLLSICITPDKNECKRFTEREGITWQVVCDGTMLDGKLVQLLGLNRIPDNIIVRNGKITDRGLDTESLLSKLQSYIK